MTKNNLNEINKTLVFDLDNIFKWVCNNDGNTDTQITETYQTDDSENIKLIERQVNEIKNRSESTMSTIKYDFIKLCISSLEIPLTSNEKSKTIASSLIENTLIYNKMIKEVKL